MMPFGGCSFSIINLLAIVSSPRSAHAQPVQVAHRRPYRHPLLGAPIHNDGKIAAVDTVETEGFGRTHLRYAVVHQKSIADGDDRSGGGGTGSATTASGVVLLRRGARRAGRGTPAPSPPPSVDRRLEAEIARLLRTAPDAAVSVTVALRRPGGTLTGAVRRAVAAGAVADVADLHRVARRHRLRRRRAILRHTRRVAEAIRELGGDPGYLCRNAHCLAASLPARAVSAVAGLAEVQRISEVEELRDEAGAWDAEDRSEAMQVNQFLEDGYDGEQVPGTFRDDIWFAVVESKNYDDEHPCWGKAGVNWKRIGSRFVCDDGDNNNNNNSGCQYITNFPAPVNPDDPFNQKERHPTQVAALIFADTTDGQDPNLDDPHRHSGFARNALGRLFRADTTAAWDEVIDEIRGFEGPYEHVVNLSQGGSIACNGDEAAASSVNSLFEDGTLLIKSAGNEGYSTQDPSLCKVTSPGAAIGAFTVAGVKSAAGVGNMRSADIWYEWDTKGSSVGGSEADLNSGRGRTIIDISAAAYLKFVPRPNSVYGSIVQGTSFATPQVTGAAINFIDYFQDREFNLEYEPGYLYANLLLMGDRTACHDEEGVCGTSKLETGFDRRFGGGRAKFRRFDSKGLDAPAHYGTGVIPCLGDGEVVQLEVPKAGEYLMMEGAVQYLKFVAWWYDRRHEMTGTVANIDLRLFHVDDNGVDQGTLLVSDDLYDNKERLYYEEPSGKRLVVEFVGTDTVPSDDEWVQDGCEGPGKVDVFFAYLAEDGTRDDLDGPGWDSPFGVEPESITW